MKQKRISFGQGKGSLTHNNREFMADNVDPLRTPQNITFVRQPIGEAYDHLFAESTERYNAKQKRNDRKVQGSYYEHLFGVKPCNTVRTAADKRKSFYEDVAQIGKREDSGYGTEDFQLIADCLKEYMAGFQKRNPNFYVFNAVLHMDEATPHLHIDYIPVGHYRRGQDTQNGIAQALKEMGYGEGKQAIARWRAAEVEVLNKICFEHGIKPLAPEKARGTLEIPEYKEKRRQADELAVQNAQAAAELSKKVRQINRALKYLPDLQKNEKAEHEFLVAVSELQDMLKSGMSILRNKDSIISRIDTLESLTKKAMDKRDKADLTIYDLRQRGEEITAELDDTLDKLKAVRAEKSQLSSELQTVKAENTEYREILATLERIAPTILRQEKALFQKEKEQRQREQIQQVEHQPTKKKRSWGLE
ncbi:plasmid recombination protein [Ruminococcus bicirculans (ex Wegman et al. 2014)]|uniref:plasmid recombination protein n=1 Tax=Ruminococcus bicirculans (ex Wegman et al. 2014) TaxID=1160721 RepID=UPI003A91C09D